MTSKWTPDNNPVQARRIGKTAEETAELGAVLARISIQGIDAIDPASGKTNRRRLEEETADVLTQCYRNINKLGLDEDFIQQRIIRKAEQMDEWEAFFPEEQQ